MDGLEPTRESTGQSLARSLAFPEALRRYAHLPASEMIVEVAVEVCAFAGGEPQQDDLTMVIIKRVAGGSMGK